jgi:hypothetical protein
MAKVEFTTGGRIGRIDEGLNPAGGTMTHDLTPTLDSQWQPMASAPHNEDILVFSRRWGLMIAAFRPEFNAWFSRMQCPAALNDDDAEHFTHWMPLPGRPQRADGARATVTGLPPGLARFLERASTRDAA